jgi:hypothetical protein
MVKRDRSRIVQTLHFSKLIRAPLTFVYRWCTDYREDDDRITNSIYHYRARIALREPKRVVRVITVPARDRRRSTDVEIIQLHYPDRWHLTKLSATDDETGNYRLTSRGRRLTLLEMRFRRTWKLGQPPSTDRYRALFNRVWDRYVEVMEAEYRQRTGRRRGRPRGGSLRA